MSYLEDRFMSAATQFVSSEKANRLMAIFKERAIGHFFSCTPTNDFTAEEFDVFMASDRNKLSIDGYRFVEAYENEIVATMQEKMLAHYDVQMKAALSLLETF
ncbi:hypothetical protein [Thiomicrospira sp.]|uniref:hypothetical protein n=1 Tax=Thiomicrospira sp. TaxID=935 RepID=UPI002F948207